MVSVLQASACNTDTTDTASKSNEYQEYFLGVKAAGE